MDEWKIARRNGQCTTCNHAFSSEEPHYSAILESDEAFRRQDFCLPCWNEKKSEAFSYWETKAPLQEERKLDNIQGMIDFFSRLISESLESPGRQKITYLLSLLLMRRRRIKLISTQRGFLDLETVWNGESIRIPDPAIGEGELEELKGEMENLFAQIQAAPSPALSSNQGLHSLPPSR